jgi:hypothetical protein
MDESDKFGNTWNKQIMPYLKNYSTVLLKVLRIIMKNLKRHDQPSCQESKYDFITTKHQY